MAASIPGKTILGTFHQEGPCVHRGARRAGAGSRAPPGSGGSTRARSTRTRTRSRGGRSVRCRSRSAASRRRFAQASDVAAPQPQIGTAFVHSVLDDHSRVAYAEIHDDEIATTAIGVLRRAVAWFAARGITIERVLTDNSSPY